MEGLMTLWSETGIANFEFGQICMMLVGCLLLFLAIRKGFEPLTTATDWFRCSIGKHS